MFCTHCGSKISSGARFCENCGTPVDQTDSVPADTNTKTESVASGIIITNTQILSRQMNCSESEVLSVLNTFVSDSVKRGIHYEILQVRSNNCNAIINELLRQNDSVRYVFIVGGQAVAESIYWQNPARDSDSTVSSDLPYSVLNTASPAGGMKYDFSKALRVGRYPVYSGQSIESFKKYFSRISAGNGLQTEVKTVGLTALQWSDTSGRVYEKFRNGYLYESPDITYRTVNQVLPSDVNLLYFNLHGSNKAKYWYGQHDAEYPEAFAPEAAEVLKTPYYCGVEACYGARYISFSQSDSVLLSMLHHNCLGLFGSSTIAYGTPRGTGSCADILVGCFLQNLSAGMTAGDAVCDARRIFYENHLSDDSDSKTLMQFDFYGDPSSCLTGKKTAVSESETSGKSGSSGKSLIFSSIAMPDIRKAVRTSLARTDAEISSALESYMQRNHPDLQGIVPEIIQLSGIQKRFQNIYVSNDEMFSKIVKIYYDENGTVVKDIESK